HARGTHPRRPAAVVRISPVPDHRAAVAVSAPHRRTVPVRAGRNRNRGDLAVGAAPPLGTRHARAAGVRPALARIRPPGVGGALRRTAARGGGVTAAWPTDVRWSSPAGDWPASPGRPVSYWASP